MREYIHREGEGELLLCAPFSMNCRLRRVSRDPFFFLPFSSRAAFESPRLTAKAWVWTRETLIKLSEEKL